MKAEAIERIRASQVDRLKQACVDMSKDAVAFFDMLDEHGVEAPWKAEGALTLVRISNSFEELRSFFAMMATHRLRALGIPYDEIAKAGHKDGSADVTNTHNDTPTSG